MKNILVASSSTLDGLLRSAKVYWYGSEIRFEGEKVFNAKGQISGAVIKKVKGRYRLEIQ